MLKYDKLVRDLVPQVIRADGKVAHTRILSEAEFLQALFAKLIEEAQELAVAPAELRLPEVADVLEVIQAIVDVLDLTESAIETEREAKAAARGAFRERIFLESVEDNDPLSA